MLYVCDGPWLDRHMPAVRASGFSGEVWTQDASGAAKHGLHHVKAYSRKGLCREPDVIYHGRNSGYQAIGLAYMWGAARVLLLGYDMQHTGGKAHWFGDHPRGLNNATGAATWAEQYSYLAKDAKEVGLEIVNCSRETALKCFRRSTIDDALCGV